jgi:phosphate transport system substrate-binding protein
LRPSPPRPGEVDQKEYHRMTRICKTAGLIAFLAAIAGVCGCNKGDDATKPAAAVIVDGSSTVYRISKSAQEAFNGIDPEITVVVDNHGTGGGFSRYLKGEVDIVDA